MGTMGPNEDQWVAPGAAPMQTTGQSPVLPDRNRNGQSYASSRPFPCELGFAAQSYASSMPFLHDRYVGSQSTRVHDPSYAS